MKFITVLLAAAAGVLLPGCGNLDLAPESNPERVVNGTLNFGGTLPAGAQVLVRVVDVRASDLPRAGHAELPLTVADRTRAMPVERVLGEQSLTLPAPATGALPFRVEYRADDMTLRHGLNLEARVSYDGKIRYRTMRAHALTLGSVNYKHEVELHAVQ